MGLWSAVKVRAQDQLSDCSLFKKKRTKNKSLLPSQSQALLSTWMRKYNNQKAVGDSSLSRRRGGAKVQFRAILTNLKHPVRAERNFSQTPKSSQPAPGLSLGRETGTNWECRNALFPCKGHGVFPFKEKHHFCISSIPSLAHFPSQCGAFKHRKLRGKEPMERGQDCSENRD